MLPSSKDTRWLRPFVWVAWLGVFTTAANTLVPMLIDFGVSEAAATTLRTWRVPVLLMHSLATLLPMLGLALLALARAPFAATLAAAVILIEKSLELIGFALVQFPPEEALGTVAVRDVVAAVWDQLYFVLWTCNTLGAAAAGWMMLRLRGGGSGRIALLCAWGASALTLLLILGADYLKWPVPAPPGWLFFAVFTAYRVALALTLQAALKASVASTSAGERP